MGITVQSPKKDDRPRRGLWAPGRYFCRCGRCAVVFEGDKRALTCADCAYRDPTPEEVAANVAFREFCTICEGQGMTLEEMLAAWEVRRADQLTPEKMALV